MRIAHFISSLDPRAGGPSTAVAGMVKAQADVGLRVSLLATYREGAKPDVQALVDGGVEVELIGPATGPLQRHPSLLQKVQEHLSQADVVHIHTVWEEIQYLAARQASKRSVPYVVTPHGMLTSWSLHQKWLKKRIYMAWRLARMLDRASAIHYTTEMERDASANLRLRPKPIVEPLGIPLEEFEQLPSRQEFRARFPQLGNSRVIVFLGRIHPGKGLEYLVPASNLIKNVPAMLVIVGPDSKGYEATIRTTAAQLGIQERIIFTGMLKGRERIEALTAADIFCLPSDHENFGLSVIEALAAGTPVVISKEVGVWREIVAAGVGSVSPREPGALATELTGWLKDDAKRQAAAERCRPFVWDRYDWRKIGQRWEQTYRLLGQPRDDGAVAGRAQR